MISVRFTLIFLCLTITHCQIIFLTTNGTSTNATSTSTTTVRSAPINVFHDWLNGINGTNSTAKNCLATRLITGSRNCQVSADYQRNAHNETEYVGYDGWYNNIARPDSGAIDRPLLRRWPAAYADGSYEPSGGDRPQPMELSEELLKLEHVGTQTINGKTAFLVFFGQQLVEEVLDAQRPACPPEYFNIEIPENHTLRQTTHHTVLPLLRTRYDARTGYSPNNPRQQLNEITPYFDGGLFYGTSKAWADYLRTNENGTLAAGGLLAATEDGLFPAYNKQRLPMANPPPPTLHKEIVEKHELLNVSRFFKLGNPRGNENTFLLSFGILWFRWHNYLARNLKNLNYEWSDEKVFNEARKWVIATHQHVVVNQWLPIWLGEGLPMYDRYDPSIDPQIDQFFQAVAMRFGHTLVVPGVYLRDYARNGCRHTFPTWGRNAVRTCNSFWRPQDAILTKVHLDRDELMDIDRLLMGMASQLCEKEDHKIVEDLRGNVFGPLEFSRRDLMAINIQRARDHGLPDYNTARKAFGLDRITLENFHQRFAHVNETIRAKFLSMHKNNFDIIDPWVGGIMETNESGPGELFRTIIKDQFRRIRDGDRFWFENRANGLFTTDEILRIKNLTIYDIVLAVTKMDRNDIPRDPFRAFTNAEFNRTHPCHRSFVSSGNFFSLPQLNETLLNENCTTAGTYDYFYNSEVSFIISFTAISAFIVGMIAVVFLMTSHQNNMKKAAHKSLDRAIRDTFQKEKKYLVPYTVNEWTGQNRSLQPIVILLDVSKQQIQVNTQKGKLLRAIDFSSSKKIQIYVIQDKLHLLLRLQHEYDLVLKFDSEFLRNNFIDALETFISEAGIERQRIHLALKPMYKQAVTKLVRQKQLDTFFRVVFAQAFEIKHSPKELLTVDSKFAKDIIYTEITITEFADALAMKADSEFVRRIFNLIDKDKNSFVSFREFLDMLFIFAKGSPRQKAKLLFDMYDINQKEYLTEEDFQKMIRSVMEICHATVQQDDLDKAIHTIKKDLHAMNKKGLNFEDFYKLLAHDIEKVGRVNINFSNMSGDKAGNSYLDQAQGVLEDLYQDPRELASRIQGEVAAQDDDGPKSLIDDEQEIWLASISITRDYRYQISRTIETNIREIFWVVMFTLVVLGIFSERAYYYSVEREHSGLRRIAGYGVTVTRGAASAQMFTYSVLILTMCRNTITVLRETFLNKYIPFDRSVEMHKYIACWALFFTVLHIIGHAFNFYHISTQTADDLTCLFRNYFHATHELPKFHYWCWQTMTGLTGVILTLITTVIYVSAIPGITRYIFWLGHNLYPLFYIFMFLHGSGRLIQEPFFPYFFVGPLVLFIVDSVMTARRKKVEIRVLNADLLPSDVTKLEFKRPNNFEYKSGQWVRIACCGLNSSEFHPFTLSSSPDEVNLTVHIRTVGPWTRAIRSLYDPSLVLERPLPKIHLDGPYGEGHQDWYRYDVSVLVGGGIGVTPFASILKDIVFRANKANRANCKKVYFIWVTRTQKQFEWLVDILRDVEISDTTRTVSSHIFVTQFYHKFDLRTTLLYICEKHFQRISGGRSLFTGLKAVTHFGRPEFGKFFKSVQTLHSDVSNFGVFSCGPPPMTSSVDTACLQLNKLGSGSNFEHHYKNF